MSDPTSIRIRPGSALEALLDGVEPGQRSARIHEIAERYELLLHHGTEGLHVRELVNIWEDRSAGTTHHDLRQQVQKLAAELAAERGKP